MEVKTTRNTVNNITAEKEVKYSIDDSAVVHITRILRNMYEDPVLAVVREYMANAGDAHNQIKQTKPFKVSIPTSLSPTFSVRDYGPGLCEADVERLLLGYGASGEHKREAASGQVGGFGVGCKCAFAVADSFTYTSYHEGQKQVWLCELDDSDQGTAKLISTSETTDTGMLIEVPASREQIREFANHTRNIAMWFNTALTVDGELVDKDERMEETMSGDLPDGVDWVLGHPGRSSNIGSVSVRMGDLIYPVDLKQIPETCGKRLLKIMGTDRTAGQQRYYGTNSQRRQACIINAPINAFALAPTRESLQYDVNTRNALKKVIDDIEADLTATAQLTVDRADDILNAAHTALGLQNDLLYKTIEEPQKVGLDKVFFMWRGKKYEFAAALSIPFKKKSKSGATVTLVSRDVKKNSSYSYRRTSNNMKIRHIYLQGHVQAGEVYHDIPLSTMAVSDPLRALTKHTKVSQYNYGNSDKLNIRAIGWQQTVTGKGLAKLTLLEPIQIYTMDPKPNMEFYTRRFYTQNDIMISESRGMSLVIQGTEAERNAFLAEHPWLSVCPIEHMELIASVTTGAAPKAKTKSPLRTVDGLFTLKMTGGTNSTAPSQNWEAITSRPAGDVFYMPMERFVPYLNHPTNAYSSDVIESNQWARYTHRMLPFLYKTPPTLYGFRVTASKPLPTADGILPIKDELDKVMRKWFDPKHIKDFEVSGLHLLARFGPNNLFGTMRLPDQKMFNTRSPGSGYIDQWSLKNKMLEVLRHPEAQKVILGYKASSPMRILLKEYLKATGLDKIKEDKLTAAYNVFDPWTAGSIRAAALQLPMYAHDKYEKEVWPGITKHLEPVHKALNDVWAKYPMIGMLDAIDNTVDHRRSILQYVKLIDKG